MKRNIFLIFLILCIGSEALAAPKICLQSDGDLITRKRSCRGTETRLSASNFLAALDNGGCDDCSQDISGTWSYYLNPDNASPGITRQVTFTIAGKTFTGSNTSHTFSGSIDGTSFQMVQVVTGEVTEGFVRLIQGNFYEIDGGFKRLLGFYHDSNGGRGSFVASFVP